MTAPIAPRIAEPLRLAPDRDEDVERLLVGDRARGHHRGVVAEAVAGRRRAAATPGAHERARRERRDEVDARLRGQVLVQRLLRALEEESARGRGRSAPRSARRGRAPPGRRRRSRGPCRPTRTSWPGKRNAAVRLMPARAPGARRRAPRSGRARATASRRARKARAARGSARPASCAGRPSIGGCAGSSSQGWTVKTAGSPRSRKRASAAARRASDRMRNGHAPPSGSRRPKTRPRQRRHLRQRPAVAVDPVRALGIVRRCRAAARASSRRRSGSPRPRARRAPATPASRIDHSAARYALAPMPPPASSIDCRARGAGRPGTPARVISSARRCRSPWTPISWPRARPRARGCGYRRAIQPRKKTVAR